MNRHNGLLDSIGVNQITPLLISFTVATADGTVNCIFSDSKIADKILFLPNKTYNVIVMGVSDSKNQFAVTEIKILNPDSTIRKLGL